MDSGRRNADRGAELEVVGCRSHRLHGGTQLGYHALVRKVVTMALVALSLAACNCGAKSGGGQVGNGGGGDPGACDAHADRVQKLYARAAAAAATPDEKPEAATLRGQEVADNTAMVLADCRKMPDRFAPCLARAASVEQMERDCLVPLDDEGKVEGSYFRQRSPAAGER